MQGFFSADLWNGTQSGWGYAAITLGIFLALALRYFVLVGGFYWFFWSRGSERWGGRKVYHRDPGGRQVASEILWSLATCATYSILGVFLLHAWRQGGTLIYTDVADHGWAYLVGSVFLVAVFHETYFYWVHRIMHAEPLYSLIHRVHHQFVQPGPWAAFSFHPVEVVTEHLILPVLVFLIPLHPLAIGAYLLLMALSGAINHLGIEIFSRGDGRGGIGRWIIGATHHAQHHRLYLYNYGLYFTFWDRVAGTQHPDFERDFAKATGAAAAGEPGR